MYAYIILSMAILAEVFASTMLKLSYGFTKWLPVVGVVIGYTISFGGLSISLTEIPLGVTYAIWSGLGTVLTVLVGIIAFGERANRKKFIGALCIIVGIILLNLAK